MAKKKNQNAVGIFFSFFLKAIVIILGLVILAMSAYLIKAVISNKSNDDQKKADDSAFEDDQEDELLKAGATSTDALLYENADEVESEESAGESNALGYDASIVVLNATETPGLAAAWKDKLTESGYTNVQTGNYTKGQLDSSKIVVETDGSGEALQALLPNAKMETLPANEVSCDVSTDGVQAFLIIGASDNILAQ